MQELPGLTKYKNRIGYNQKQQVGLEVKMDYVFYADVCFLTNFYLDFLAVLMTGEVLGRKIRWRRYLAGTALGSLIGCVLFPAVRSYDLYLFIVHFMVNPGMTLICFFPAKLREYQKAFCLMYFSILLLGGSMQWLYQTVFAGRAYEICLLLCAVPAGVFLYIIRIRRKKVNCFYLVEVCYRGNKVAVRALFDTGNRLQDPYVHMPVHIIDADRFEALTADAALPVRLIPFSSVGCENGLLRACTVDGMRIGTGNGVWLAEWKKPVLAVAGEEIFAGRSYQMILNSSVGEWLEGREDKSCT